ncbi:MAG: hypothetical protein ACRETD_08820, partial [Steroidobacteraceae bacterium]
MTDIVVSLDFFPQIGGAHLWLYQTYRRWPTPVTLVTRRYESGAEEREAQAAFDVRDHGALRIDRLAVPIAEINLLDAGCWRKFMHAARRVRALSGRHRTTLH